VIRFLFQRLIGIVIVVWVIMTVSFFMIHIAPGGPFDMDRSLPPDILKNIEEKYHLNEPLWKQYTRYVGDIVLHGDLGPSYKYADRSVNEFIKEGLPVTLTLGAYALFFACLIGITSGVLSSLRHNTRWDYAAMGLAILGVSIPDFVLGPLLQLFFGLKLRLFPVAGWEGLSYYVLPAVTLGSMYAASIARLTRGGMLEITRQDYIRTARAKGLPAWLIVMRHMLRGGLIPVLTYLGPATASILSGSLVIEKIFNIPGLGRHFVNSALNRDYTVTLGMVIFYSTLILLCNFVVDILYSVFDPRVRNT
jgi:oligopeptide transport system permease protein